MLILISGLPGSGKTTLARVYAEQYDALHLNSDALRTELGLRGRYKPEDKEKVYLELLKRAGQALLNGKQVIIDSTFYKDTIREPFRKLAADCNSALRWVELQTPVSIIYLRLQTPRADSEADFSVYEKIRAEYEPITEPHLILHTEDMSMEQMVLAIHQYIL